MVVTGQGHDLAVTNHARIGIPLPDFLAVINETQGERGQVYGRAEIAQSVMGGFTAQDQLNSALPGRAPGLADRMRARQLQPGERVGQRRAERFDLIGGNLGAGLDKL